jgi:hypothetical protein
VSGVLPAVLQVRQSAGLLLKNNLKAQYAALSEDFRNYIKVSKGGGGHQGQQGGPGGLLCPVQSVTLVTVLVAVCSTV